MKSLLAVILTYYYRDIRRIIPSSLSKRIDCDIRSLSANRGTLSDFVRTVRSKAMAQRRTIS